MSGLLWIFLTAKVWKAHPAAAMMPSIHQKNQGTRSFDLCQVIQPPPDLVRHGVSNLLQMVSILMRAVKRVMANSSSPSPLSAQDPAKLLKPLPMLCELDEETAAPHYLATKRHAKSLDDCPESFIFLRVLKSRAGYGIGSSEPSSCATG